MTQSDLQDLQDKIADALKGRVASTGDLQKFVANRTIYPSQYTQHALECLEARGVISSSTSGGVTVWSLA